MNSLIRSTLLILGLKGDSEIDLIIDILASLVLPSHAALQAQ